MALMMCIIRKEHRPITHCFKSEVYIHLLYFLPLGKLMKFELLKGERRALSETNFYFSFIGLGLQTRMLCFIQVFQNCFGFRYIKLMLGQKIKATFTGFN